MPTDDDEIEVLHFADAPNPLGFSPDWPADTRALVVDGVEILQPLGPPWVTYTRAELEAHKAPRAAAAAAVLAAQPDKLEVFVRRHSLTQIIDDHFLAATPAGAGWTEVAAGDGAVTVEGGAGETGVVVMRATSAGSSAGVHRGTSNIQLGAAPIVLQMRVLVKSFFNPEPGGFRVGLSDSDTAPTPNNGVLLAYSAASLNWQLLVVDAGSVAQIDTGTAVSARQNVAMMINPTANVVFVEIEGFRSRLAASVPQGPARLMGVGALLRRTAGSAAERAIGLARLAMWMGVQ